MLISTDNEITTKTKHPGLSILNMNRSCQPPIGYFLCQKVF